MNVYDFSAKTIEGKDKPLSEYRGKVLLIVNVASRCGFTPQYEGLQKLYAKYQPKGLEILGFPCNQFGAQEPGTESEIQSFCELNFGVKFQLFAKIDVNGEKTHPLFKYLTKDLPGILGTEAIKWNFAKFLVDKEGNPVKRYGSAEKPEGLEKDIEKLL
jgi:glutathione peroxidase